ncbi:MAG TPA: hypothetical protein VLY20_12515 [Nitrospiria bacterium]|nr:hypothetical protein [Nitrospiria bacterium]
MAKGMKTGGRDWKKGEAPKSSGRPPDSPEAKKLKSYLRSYLEETGAAIDDFEKLRKEDPGAALRFAADRIWGRPKESVEHSGGLTLPPPPPVDKRTIQERIEELRQIALILIECGAIKASDLGLDTATHQVHPTTGRSL